MYRDLQARAVLVKKYNMQDSMCLIYQYVPKTFKHIFFQYYFTQLIWFIVSMYINLSLLVFLVFIYDEKLYYYILGAILMDLYF